MVPPHLASIMAFPEVKAVGARPPRSGGNIPRHRGFGGRRRPGCPTGVIAGTNTKFPTHYRDALFICDWTFATMYSIHLKPQGSSYIGEKREFVSNTTGLLGLDRHRHRARWQHVLLRGRTRRTILPLQSLIQGIGYHRVVETDTTSEHAEAATPVTCWKLSTAIPTPRP